MSILSTLKLFRGSTSISDDIVFIKWLKPLTDTKAKRREKGMGVNNGGEADSPTVILSGVVSIAYAGHKVECGASGIFKALIIINDCIHTHISMCIGDTGTDVQKSTFTTYINQIIQA